ncbi:drug:H+ antiporter-2 (14 Spanner) (DHA2) family drug resistance MFS transporter [Bacteroides intestinalis CAG:315]|uniref:DHA2 family efflux MFS transporter permease subunit n=1 Tax=Bacteroides intestinalis TaxID=329854 RepID=A0A412YHZ3_9BACE|nr:MFS transporter [Bacteroides intestinalis]RGV57056.1 DHA2 family efflux MFS transporter permease subunit [Bacteroides intestinalis]RHA60824.1 DHA2 family efflux MFS transporter permease subunit [Bacteroides intestinalis]CDD97447.1 drug:H+ antiporter-2 (14 Spanner) (DHA2) family drug resistance MFS transporter [Bacteroides intestinalis CAG:315]
MVQDGKSQEIDETDGLPFPQRIWAVVAIGFALCMSVLDINISTVILPTLAHDFGTSDSMITWIVNGYQLAIVVSLLSFSALGEIFGYRKVFLSGIALFCVTSLICALSDSFWTLTTARIFQGFSASAITSVNTAQLRLIYPKKQIGRGMGINAMVIAISAAAGPSVASGILSIASWHWLFAINLPLGIIALILGIKYLPEQKELSKRKFDVISAVANAITFGLLIYTLDGFAHHERYDYLILQLVILIVVGTYYVRRQLGQESPLLPLDLLKIPIFRLSILTSICSFTAQMLAMISLPFFLQNTLGHSEVMTGLLLTPWPLATLFAAPVAGYLVERIHPGILGSIGMGIFCIGLYSLSMLDAESSILSICLRSVLCGIGFGLFQTPNNSTIIASAPTKRSGGASGMMGMARLMGQTLGTTLVALLFSWVVGSKSTEVCLITGSVFALIAAVVSSLRLSQASVLKE